MSNNQKPVQHLDTSPEDYERSGLLAPDTKKKADWRNNPLVPLGSFGGAVALAAGIIIGRRNSAWGTSQVVMQARVIAQAVCVGGLVAVGALTAMHQSDDKPAAKK